MKNLSNQSGFALVEVMVAAGLLGVIAYLFMSMGEQVARMDAQIKDSMELNELTNRLQICMGDANSCDRTFAPLFGSLKTNEKLNFPIKIERLVNRFGSTLLETGTRYGRFNVDSIEAHMDQKSFPDKNFDSMLGFIKIRYRLSSASNKSYSKGGDILLSAVVKNPHTSSQGPYLFACASEKSLLIQEITDEVISRTCASFGVPYNSVTGTCNIGNASSYIQPSTNPNINKTQAEELENMEELKQKAMKMMEQFMQENQ